MKRILIISIIMINLLNILGCQAQGEIDPYWEFNENEHFQPKLNKGDFFKLSAYDFSWFILEPLSQFINDREHEIERGKSLSHGQKALYYWWYLDAEVLNGGFVQFYYNGYGQYVSTIIKGLEYIGDKEMAQLVKKADKIYRKNKKWMDKAQESDLFGSDLYERLDELSQLDDNYYDLSEQTLSLIERYIRNNPNEFCLDEDGQAFDMNFSGRCKTFYPSNKIKEEFELELGLIKGEYKSFYENGNLKESIHYSQGKPTGERDEYHENGQLKYEIKFDSKKKTAIHKWYYDNGNPQKLEMKLIEEDERFGDYKEWYVNGQLAEIGRYKSAIEREGPWLEFYENGAKKVEAKFVNGDFILENHWNEKGEQSLSNGTGLYVYEYSMFGDDIERNEQEYYNYKRHGKQKTFTNGVLSLYQEMKNGKEHGFTRSYYNNGNLKEEIQYQEGRSISVKKFPKFIKPKVKTKLVSRLCKNCYARYKDYQLPDNDPLPTNHVELTEEFHAEASIFEAYGDDHIMTYGYYVFVNEKGKASDIKFAVADNLWLEEQVKASMMNLKFEPALKNGKPIKSIHYVRYQLELTE